MCFVILLANSLISFALYIVKTKDNKAVHKIDEGMKVHRGNGGIGTNSKSFSLFKKKKKITLKTLPQSRSCLNNKLEDRSRPRLVGEK